MYHNSWEFSSCTVVNRLFATLSGFEQRARTFLWQQAGVLMGNLVIIIGVVQYLWLCRCEIQAFRLSTFSHLWLLYQWIFTILGILCGFFFKATSSTFICRKVLNVRFNYFANLFFFHGKWHFALSFSASEGVWTRCSGLWQCTVRVRRQSQGFVPQSTLSEGDGTT